MMNRRSIFVAAAVALACGTASAGSPGDGWPRSPKEAKAFVSTIPADAWTKITAASLSLKYFVNRPIVAVFNPLDEDVINLVCDGKWSLVGANAYDKNKGAPESISAHTVGFIPTDGFDDYCKQSIVALTDSGEKYEAVLQIPGDFTHSTAIFIMAH
jgi:hypothetical protein